MKKLFNVDHQTVIVDHDLPGVAPGEAYEFDDETAAGLTGLWSEQDPRAGLTQERKWKRERDAAQSNPAEPEE